jgi:hypothetical protein
MARTVTLEIELDVDVAEGERWTNDTAQAFEDWLDREVLAAVDGRAVDLQGVGVRIQGHSLTRVSTAWPYR